MNTSFQQSRKRTDEWYTPKYIIEALGEFDLDPCAPTERFYTARKCYTKEIDGLAQSWKGRVFCNPPYSQPLISQFIKKMSEHGNGIALLFNRCDNTMFYDIIFPTASAMRFLRKRIRFLRPDGSVGGSPGCGSVLVAWGEDNAKTLEKCTLEGKFIKL